MRPLLAAAFVAGLVAGCGGHGQEAATTVPRKPPSIVVRFDAQTHRPQVGKPWHYEVRVTNAAGKPVPASVHLQILFAGVPVGQIGRHRVRNGVWRETIGAGRNPPFPARARGQPLVFEAVVTANGETKKVDWWIRVR